MPVTGSVSCLVATFIGTAVTPFGAGVKTLLAPTGKQQAGSSRRYVVRAATAADNG